MVGNPMETSPDQNLPEPTAATPLSEPKTKRRLLPHGCWLWSFAALLIFVLAGLALPCFGCIGVKGMQTKSLAQAKQIGLALMLFAGDHDGHYPGQGYPAEMKDTPRNANQAFACLFPTYTESERLFGNKLSAYQTDRGPDNVIDNPYTGHPVDTLRPGENVYGYVMGLVNGADPNSPLVVDGSDGTGHYNTDEHRRGGLWSGTKAVVIYFDNHGVIETLRGPDNTRYIPRGGDLSKNALETSYLGKDVRYLDPAVAGP